MNRNTSGSSGDDLQFDRVEGAGAIAEPAAASVVCSTCQTTIRTAYFNVDAAATCGRCKVAAEMRANSGRGWGTFFKAGAFGLIAAIAGAILYYGVIAITELEIGLVAIVIGFMVGFAVRKGAKGNGGRRFQVLALGLTYFAVGLAYSPLAVKGIKDGIQARATAAAATKTTGTLDAAVVDSAVTDSVAVSDSTAVASDSPVAGGKLGFGWLLLGLAGVFVFIFALPVIVVFGSLPGGLISALIIGFGMQQAWRMTGAKKLEITGPFKVNAPPSAESAA
jgi:hypothetical protein